MSFPMSSICIKYLLFLFNLLFVVSGVIILSVGVTIKAFFHEYELFLDDKYFSTANLLIAIGAIIFLIAFFGCCGAVKESFCMTITFSTLLILIFVLEFAAGISGYVLRNQTVDYLSLKLNESLHYYNSTNVTPVTILWDNVQKDFDCCGVNNYKDWMPILKELPMSCCGPTYGQIGTSSCTSNTTSLRVTGCVEGFGKFVEDHVLTIAGIGLGLAFIQILGIIFACHLARQIKKNYETV